MSRWPKDNQADLIAFYGVPKSAALAAQLVTVIPPFRMTYEGKQVKAITFHRKAAPALLAALTEIWEHYGKDQAKLDALGISRYDGAYNPRYVRGSDSKWSNHAYGAAIDINAQDNGQDTGHGNMPQPVIDAFKRQGARWGGDYKHSKTDPMHFEFCDNGEPDMPAASKPVVDTPAASPNPERAAMRLRMAKAIIDFEARRDKAGHFVIYDLPANDGGGRYEVAGINEKYDKEKCDQLVTLIRAGKFDEAETVAAEYIAANTDPATKFTSIPSVESFLRDCVFNRGVRGATRILQRALLVKDDGDFGTISKAAMREAEKDPQALLRKLRVARENYERDVVGYRANLWKGLVNRWDGALKVAKTFPDTPSA